MTKKINCKHLDVCKEGELNDNSPNNQDDWYNYNLISFPFWQGNLQQKCVGGDFFNNWLLLSLIEIGIRILG